MRTAPTMCQLCFFTPLLGCWRENVFTTQLSSSVTLVSRVRALLYLYVFFCPALVGWPSPLARSPRGRRCERAVAQWGQINDGNALSSNSSMLSNPAMTAVRHCDAVLPLPCDRLLTCPASHPVHAGISVSLLQLLTAQVGTWMDGWMDGKLPRLTLGASFLCFTNEGCCCCCRGCCTSRRSVSVMWDIFHWPQPCDGS